MPNHARYVFLEPRPRAFYANWDRAAADTVAILRAEAGRNPASRALSDLVGELSTRSTTFSALWAAHNVRWHTAGVKTFHHPIVGDLTLQYEAMDLTADPGQKLLAFTAEPGSPSRDSLRAAGQLDGRGRRAADQINVTSIADRGTGRTSQGRWAGPMLEIWTRARRSGRSWPPVGPS